jgi:hypothetical protein
VVGSFTAAFGLSLHSSASTIAGTVNGYVGAAGVAPDPSFENAVLAQIASYVQQNVTTVWSYYLGIGIVLAICGSVIVVIGDRKPANAKEETPFETQPLSVKRRD